MLNAKVLALLIIVSSLTTLTLIVQVWLDFPSASVYTTVCTPLVVIGETNVGVNFVVVVFEITPFVKVFLSQ